MQLLNYAFDNGWPVEHELVRIDCLKSPAKRSRNAEASYARLERGSDFGKKRLKFSVVPFALCGSSAIL